MDRKKQGIIGLVIGIVAAGGLIWYNVSSRLAEANEAADEVCSCLEENSGNAIQSNVQRSVCLRLLSEYENIKKSNLESAIKKRCPDLAHTIEIIEK